MKSEKLKIYDYHRFLNKNITFARGIIFNFSFLTFNFIHRGCKSQ